MAERDDIERKLSAASTWLIIDKPFLGALVLRMPVLPATSGWCHTTATDARVIYYNPDYIAALDLEQTKFALAHEALHCALQHFHRRGHRDKHRWDVACDHAINPLLAADGLKPPPDALLVPGFEGMTAEEIYPLIQDNTREQPHDDHAYDSEPPQNRGGERAGQPGGGTPDEDQRGAGDEDSANRPAPLSSSEREALALQWRQRLAGAAQQALQAGKLRGSLARLVDHLLQPQLPWRMLLARYMTSVARDDYSFQRPSRREGTAILPSLRSAQVNLAVVLDTSGSISDSEMQEFVSEVNAIKGQVGARIVLHACDERLAPDGPWTYEPWEEMHLPGTFHGGGGTRFTPAFDWIAACDRKPDLLIYFTDAQGEFPEQEPAYPVLWLVKGKSKVPWGLRVQLN
jgi:predicted metal-dependent peptidase